MFHQPLPLKNTAIREFSLFLGEKGLILFQKKMILVVEYFLNANLFWLSMLVIGTEKVQRNQQLNPQPLYQAAAIIFPLKLFII